MNNTDLISRSALLGGYDVRKVTEYDESGCGLEYKAVSVEAIEAAPAIDAVEVVRCRDCKRWGTGYGGETEHIKVCEFANYMVGENGYCVYGERKMDADI